MAEAKFYRCKKCGNLHVAILGGKVTPQCCGEPMEVLEAGVTDAATEKHVPVVTREGDTVRVAVGEVAHPMTAEHLIQFVAVVTDDRIEVAKLDADDAPEATFAVAAGVAGTAYEYCNLHGLWKADF